MILGLLLEVDDVVSFPFILSLPFLLFLCLFSGKSELVDCRIYVNLEKKERRAKETFTWRAPAGWLAVE